MSAYVVDEETINRVLTFAEWGDSGYQLRHEYPDRGQLGRDMYALNLDAVHARYPDCETDDDLPGTIAPKSYEYRLAGMVGIHQALKSLQCWLYQCTEGDTPTRELYKFMRGFEHNLMDAIIDKMPEYKAADWG